MLSVTAINQEQTEQEVYTEAYAGYADDPVLETSSRKIIERTKSPCLAAGARILDVGCDSRAFFSAAQNAGYRPQGLDISKAAAALFKPKGLEVISGDFLSHSYTSKFAMILMWDVIKHLRNLQRFSCGVPRCPNLQAS